MPDLSRLNAIRIILVEPAGPLNVGSVARVMKNMGLHYLVLVNPQCDPLGAEARQMAVHAADILESLQIVSSLAEGLTGCRRAIATTGKPRSLATNLEHPREVLPWLLEPDEVSSAALIFGPEDRGLNNQELNYAQRFIYIPSNPVYPSLNLAQAVGICCYELYQLTQLESLKLYQESIGYSPGDGSILSAPLDELEGFYQQLEAVLLQIGYLYPHTADSRMKKFRQLFGRSFPSSQEVAMLRGILRQVTWAIQPTRKDDLITETRLLSDDRTSQK